MKFLKYILTVMFINAAITYTIRADEDCPCEDGNPPSEGKGCCGEVEFDPDEKCCNQEDASLYDKLTVSGERNICASTVMSPENTTSFIVSGGFPPYTWNSGNGEIADIFGATTGESVTIVSGGFAGTTLITVTDKNGCKGTRAVTSTYDDLTGWEDYVSCNSLFQHPNKPPETDGCSVPPGIPSGYTPHHNPLLPYISFEGPCDDHDYCYSTCPSAKENCDSTFHVDLGAQCYQLPVGLDRSECLMVADIFNAAVYTIGTFYFQQAQLNHCACCDNI